MEGMAMKYTVIKNEDINKYTSSHSRMGFDELIEEINEGRKAEGKATDHTYIVINTDEIYAQEVVEILKRHGHWG